MRFLPSEMRFLGRQGGPVPEGADETRPDQYTADPAPAPAAVDIGSTGVAGD
jgi:hypothetical protein